MKSNWKTMAASLALLVGISGAAFGQDRDDHRDGDKRARVVTQYRDNDRNDRGWKNGRVFSRDGHGRDDHARDDHRRDNDRWYGENQRNDRDRHDFKYNYREGRER
jgi:hypothetical protein